MQIYKHTKHMRQETVSEEGERVSEEGERESFRRRKWKEGIGRRLTEVVSTKPFSTHWPCRWSPLPAGCQVCRGSCLRWWVSGRTKSRSPAWRSSHCGTSPCRTHLHTEAANNSWKFCPSLYPHLQRNPVFMLCFVVPLHSHEHQEVESQS